MELNTPSCCEIAQRIKILCQNVRDEIKRSDTSCQSSFFIAVVWARDGGCVVNSKGSEMVFDLHRKSSCLIHISIPLKFLLMNYFENEVIVSRKCM